MKRVCASILVSLFCALTLPACIADGDQDGETDGSVEEDSTAAEANDSASEPIDDSGVNGQHITEAEACEALSGAQEAKNNSLECSMTTRLCPSLLRVMTGETCVEYDEGSVRKCIERYNVASSCEELADAIDGCLVTFYPGTKSADCE